MKDWHRSIRTASSGRLPEIALRLAKFRGYGPNRTQRRPSKHTGLTHAADTCSLYGVMAQSETRGAAAHVHAVPIKAAAAKDEADLPSCRSASRNPAVAAT